MTVATKARPRDEGLTTLETMGSLSENARAEHERLAQEKCEAFALLTDSLPALAAGGRVDAGKLKAALTCVGWTVEQYQADVATYKLLAETDARLDQFDREAMSAEVRRWEEDMREIRQRIMSQSNLLRSISSEHIGRHKLATTLRLKGLLVV
jgi:hypothetical protein